MWQCNSYLRSIGEWHDTCPAQPAMKEMRWIISSQPVSRVLGNGSSQIPLIAATQDGYVTNWTDEGKGYFGEFRSQTLSLTMLSRVDLSRFAFSSRYPGMSPQPRIPFSRRSLCLRRAIHFSLLWRRIYAMLLLRCLLPRICFGKKQL